jgi:TonB dependent receptor
LRPVKHLDLQGSFGISNAVVDDFNGTGLNNNTPFPNVPAYTARGSASYDIELGGDYTLTSRVDAFSRGRLYYFPNRQFRADPYTDVNLRLTLATARWSLAGYIANVGDERHSQQVAAFGPGVLRTVSDPRTYGVEFSVHFK